MSTNSPVESKNVDSKGVESKGVESHSVESKGVESKGVDSQRATRAEHDRLPTKAQRFRALIESPQLNMLNELIAAGHEVLVLFTTGNWLNCDNVEDTLDGSQFQ